MAAATQEDEVASGGGESGSDDDISGSKSCATGTSSGGKSGSGGAPALLVAVMVPKERAARAAWQKTCNAHPANEADPWYQEQLHFFLVVQSAIYMMTEMSKRKHKKDNGGLRMRRVA